MTQKPDNPQAFPVLIENWRGDVRAEMKGMSLRDYFAAAALPAIISGVCAGQHHAGMLEGETSVVPAMARNAYEIADAMLKAREATHD